MRFTPYITARPLPTRTVRKDAFAAREAKQPEKVKAHWTPEYLAWVERNAARA